MNDASLNTISHINSVVLSFLKSTFTKYRLHPKTSEELVGLISQGIDETLLQLHIKKENTLKHFTCLEFL